MEHIFSCRYEPGVGEHLPALVSGFPPSRTGQESGVIPPESPALGTEPRKIGRYIVDPRKLRDQIHDLRDSTSRAVGPGCRAMLLFYSNKRTNLNRRCKVPQKPHYPYGSGFP